MNDLTLNEPAAIKKSNLTSRFLLTGIFTVLLIVLSLALGSYAMLRTIGIEKESNRISIKTSEVINIVTVDNDSNDVQYINKIAQSFSHIEDFETITIYDTELKPIWPPSSSSKLSAENKIVAESLLKDADVQTYVSLSKLDSLEAWKDALLQTTETHPTLIKLKTPSGTAFAMARVEYNFKETFDKARYFAIQVLIAALLSSMLLFFALYYTFQRGIKTIRQQEARLNQQISRLSNLLALNKDMQRSMKTASSRAVELNEQFLRRVGADLHDGPAQMIGFAVLRLNQVSKQETAKQFGHEFHAVREALEESLEEIRGISSGLVLPELESMSLEQCLRKVVTLHSAKSKAEVAQYYQELPSNIPLPIKICAYRFIQEGLNNAHRHGDAKKCRLSAYVKDQQLVISLKDNGIGFRKSKLKKGGAHLGLVGLKDRVESLGGSFSINSELGVGTALKLVISLADDE